MQNNRIDANIINRIRREVCAELGIPTAIITENNINNQEQQVTENLEENNTNTEEENIKQKLKVIYDMYQGIPPNLKPKLPKLIRPTKKWSIIEKTNSALDDIMTENDDITTLHNLLYAGAYLVIEQNGQTIYTKKKNSPIKNSVGSQGSAGWIER